MRWNFVAVILLVLLLLASPAYCQDSEYPLESFSVNNQSPLVQGFGFPAQINAYLLPAGDLRVALRYDRVSSYTENSNARESIILDGESQRLTLSLRRGFARGWELGAEIPWVRHDRGAFDSFIIKWHDFFGLPQGGRDVAPKNRLLFRYVRDGLTQLELTEPVQGLGDMALDCAWQLSHEESSVRTSMAVGARLKMPTGDPDRLLGSGSTDLALWLAGRAEEAGRDGQYAGYFAIGALAMTRGDILAGQQRPLAVFGRFGLGWSPGPVIAFKLQLDANSSLYQSSTLQELGPAVVLTVGGTLVLPAALHLDIGVSEDLIVSASPDVGLHVALSRTF